MIASCAFGVNINSFQDKKNDLLLTEKKMSMLASFSSNIKFLVQRIVPGIMKLLRIEYLDADIRKFFSNMVTKNMKTREDQGIYRPDMIDILMKAKKGTLTYQEEKRDLDEGFATVLESSIGKTKVSRSWTDVELISQCFAFFLSAFDTTTAVLVASAYELALNPEVQERLADEIDVTHNSLHNGQLKYEILQKIKYLDMVVSEVLRVRPPVAFIDRVCTKEYDFVGENGRKFKIDKGSQLWIPIQCYHHNPQYFPNHSKFDPERFNEENRSQINPSHYIPFGSGPRACVASRFGLMTVKCILFDLLRNFTVEVSSKTQIPMIMKTSPFGIYPEKGLHLNLKPRANKNLSTQLL